MAYYPLHIDLTNRLTVVVGGGAVAMRKVRELVRADARITLVSPKTHEGLAPLIGEGGITWLERTYRSGDLKGAQLVFAATNDRDVNRQVAKDAKSEGIWVNVCDDRTESSFISPAVIRRGTLTIALSTEGQSPAMARALREELEAWFDADYAMYLDWLADVRRLLLSRVDDEEVRARILRRLVRSQARERLRDASETEAMAILASIVQEELNGS